MRSAREEVAQIRAEQRVAIALKANVPPAAKSNLKPGDSVLEYSEKHKNRSKDFWCWMYKTGLSQFRWWRSKTKNDENFA